MASAHPSSSFHCRGWPLKKLAFVFFSRSHFFPVTSDNNSFALTLALSQFNTSGFRFE